MNGSVRLRTAVPAWMLWPHVIRGAMLWVLVRAMVGAAGTLPALGSGDIASPLVPAGPLTSAIIVVAAATLAMIDARIMHEPQFHGNLGVPPWTPAVAAAVISLALEALLRVIA